MHGLIAPLIAGLIATLHPTLPYLTSLVLFLAAIPILLLILERKK